MPVEPHSLGVWLGDGSRAKTPVSKEHEAAILDFLFSHVAGLDFHLGDTGLGDRPDMAIIAAESGRECRWLRR